MDVHFAYACHILFLGLNYTSEPNPSAAPEIYCKAIYSGLTNCDLCAAKAWWSHQLHVQGQCVTCHCAVDLVYAVCDRLFRMDICVHLLPVAHCGLALNSRQATGSPLQHSQELKPVFWLNPSLINSCTLSYLHKWLRWKKKLLNRARYIQALAILLCLANINSVLFCLRWRPPTAFSCPHFTQDWWSTTLIFVLLVSSLFFIEDSCLLCFI